MLAVRCVAVEFRNYCSLLLSIMLFGGAGSMTDVRPEKFQFLEKGQNRNFG